MMQSNPDLPSAAAENLPVHSPEPAPMIAESIPDTISPCQLYLTNLALLYPVPRNPLERRLLQRQAMLARESGARVIYVCSPYRSASEEIVSRNVSYAMSCCEFVINQLCVPLAPHLIYPRFLDDNDEDERIIGFSCAMALLRRCDEIWVFGEYGVSDGMRKEFRESRRLGMRYRLFKKDMKEATWYELEL